MKVNQKQKLREAIVLFHPANLSGNPPLNQAVQAHLDLFQVVNSVTRQGDGLLWSEVKEVIKESLILAGFKDCDSCEHITPKGMCGMQCERD